MSSLLIVVTGVASLGVEGKCAVRFEATCDVAKKNMNEIAEFNSNATPAEIKNAIIEKAKLTVGNLDGVDVSKITDTKIFGGIVV